MELNYIFWIPVRRGDSIQNKRKVSSLSDRSDTSEQGGAGEVSGEESPGVLSDDQPPESPTDTSDTDDTTNMPWIKVFYCSILGILLKLNRLLNNICIHLADTFVQTFFN